MADRVRTEEFRVDGDQVIAKVKELVNEGNVRRIILRTEDGKDLIEVPLTIGVGVVGVGVLVAPVLAAIGAIADRRRARRRQNPAKKRKLNRATCATQNCRRLLKATAVLCCNKKLCSTMFVILRSRFRA